jgi:glycosyltransferase involved in cell wall biosynthesis
LRITFASEYFWPEIGGLERSTERLGARLAALGHQMRMVTQPLPGTTTYEKRSGIEVHRFATSGGVPFTARAAAVGLFADADVVCLFGVGHDPQAAWWRPILDTELAPSGVRLLKVGTEGDITVRGIPGELYRRLDGVLCQTAGIAAEAQQIGVRQTACYPVRNGLSIHEWASGLLDSDNSRRLLDVPEDAFVVAGLGRFTHRKRFSDLVCAFASFASATTSSHNGRRSADLHQIPGRPVLLLHGSDFGQDDGKEAELRALVTALPTGVDVRFVSPELDVRLTLSAADCCASLAEREGAPNVFIEAFASGRPMIATDLAGHRIYVRDGAEGLLVPVGDRQATAGALATLHGDPARLAFMSNAARNKAAHFDITDTARDYLRAFADARTRLKGTSK